jgi:hypothetical protein
VHLQRINAATRAGRVIVEMKERLLGTFLTLQKAGIQVGFEQQIKHSGSSERQKTKLD